MEPERIRGQNYGIYLILIEIMEKLLEFFLFLIGLRWTYGII